MPYLLILAPVFLLMGLSGMINPAILDGFSGSDPPLWGKVLAWVFVLVGLMVGLYIAIVHLN